MTALPLLAASSSTTFMLSVVGLSAVSAVLIALNLLSLKHRSSNRACIFGALFVLLGMIVANFTLGLRSTGQAGPPLATIPGRISAGLLALAFLVALFGVVQMSIVPRFRRGRKRGFFTLAAALITVAILFYADYAARHPKAPPAVVEDESTTAPMPTRPVPAATPKPPPAAPASEFSSPD